MEFFDRGLRDAAPFAVRACACTARVAQHALEERYRDMVRFVDRLAFAARARSLRVFRLEFDAGALCEHAERIGERKFSSLETNAMTSPPAPHPKHLKNALSGSG